jgi:excisionase family DNA binding protein
MNVMTKPSDDTERRTARSGEIAKALGLSAATIQAYAREGKIPSRSTPGGQYRFDLAEVRHALQPTWLTTPGLVSLDTPGRYAFFGDRIADGDPFDSLDAQQAAESTGFRREARHVVPSASEHAHRLTADDGVPALHELVSRARGRVAVAVLPR